MKKSMYELLFLVIATFIFSGELIARDGKGLGGEKGSERSLSSFPDDPCKSSETLYPLKNSLNETCHQEISNQLGYDVNNFLVDFNEKDSSIQKTN